MRQVHACGNPLSNLDAWLWQSAVRPFSLRQSTEIAPWIIMIHDKHLSAELGKEREV
jgi:hypothetical protein